MKGGWEGKKLMICMRKTSKDLYKFRTKISYELEDPKLKFHRVEIRNSIT